MWTEDEVRKLIALYNEGKKIPLIAREIGKTTSCILQRIYKMRSNGILKPVHRKSREGYQDVRGGRTRGVRCIETGETWGSRKEAAKAMGVSTSCIGEHIRFREPLKGLHFENNDIN